MGQSHPGAGSNPFTGLTYDSHGSIVTMGDEVHGYDAANRHLVTTQASERDALLVVGNPGSLNKRDEWMRDRLEDGGWTVTIVDDNATTAGSATGKQVVVISESVGGSGLTTAGTALASVAVPIVAAESYIFDELGMTGTGSNQGNTTNSQNSVDITAAGATHPLGAGFVQGNLTTATSAVMGHAWGKPNSNTTVAATIAGDATKATIFGYDTGATMVTGTAAAARVGFMYYGGNGATHFNDNAAQLFDASIQWAAKSAPHIEYQRDATDRITSYTVNGVTSAATPTPRQPTPLRSPSTQPEPSPNAPSASPAACSSPPGQPGTCGRTRTCTATSSPPPTTPVSSKAPPGPMTRSGTSRNQPAARQLRRSVRLGWHGQQQRPTNHQTGLTPLVEMGARQYSTQLGRFLETDPIRGGVDNDYNYPNDPINKSDLTGLTVVGSCGSFSAIGFFGISIDGCVGWDQSMRDDQAALIGSFGTRRGLLEVSLGVTGFISDAKTVDELRGASDCFDIAILVIKGAGLGLCAWTNAYGKRRNTWYAFGGWGLGVTLNGGRSSTGVTRVGGLQGHAINATARLYGIYGRDNARQINRVFK